MEYLAKSKAMSLQIQVFHSSNDFEILDFWMFWCFSFCIMAKCLESCSHVAYKIDFRALETSVPQIQ